MTSFLQRFTLLARHPILLLVKPCSWMGAGLQRADRNVLRKPRLVGGVKGHNMNDNTLPGSPFDMLRAVSSVERPRACGRGASLSYSLI